LSAARLSGAGAALLSVPMSALSNPQRPGGSLLDAVLGSVLDDLAADRVGGAAGVDRVGAAAAPLAQNLVVLDCGGGSGSRAVPLAVRGAVVTVIDSSIDALAILSRRAAEAGVGDRINGVQADVESLADVAAPASADLVLVHGVLDATRDPAHVLAAAAAVVRAGGYLSVVVPNPVAAVLTRALAGDLSSALAELAVTDPGNAAAGPRSAAVLDLDGLRVLVETAGLEVTATQGLGAFSSSVPGSVLDGQPASRAVLDELDRRGAVRSPYREIAGRLHLLARRPAGRK
jgi:S-adenosylmethionine-dependent methyltransferase